MGEVVSGLAQVIKARMKGVGDKKAKDLSDYFGSVDDFEYALVHNHELIGEIAGVKPDRVRMMEHDWYVDPHARLIVALCNFGLTYRRARALRERIQPDVMAEIIKNPYDLFTRYSLVPFKMLDNALVPSGRVLADGADRMEAACTAVLRAAQTRGDTCIHSDDAIASVSKLTGIKEIDKAWFLRSVAKRKLVYVATCGDAQYVSIPYLHNAELTVKQSLEVSSLAYSDSRLSGAYSVVDCADLTDEQKEAVDNALHYQHSIISGKAGTGKTHTVRTIAEIYVRAGKKVALCAPTGIASKRLQHSCRMPASTIHRMIGYGERGKRDVRVDADIVIVDEASMVDSLLLAQLYRACDMDTTRFVYVGDHNQIPPVGAGSPFHDIFNKQAVKVRVLNDCFRQAGDIKENANAVLEGRFVHGPSILKAADSYHVPTWITDVKIDDPMEIQDAIRYIYENYEHFAESIHDLQTVTPMREGPIGEEVLNRIARTSCRKHFGVNLGDKWYAEHDRVVCVKNDKASGVMNGEQGVVRRVDMRGLVIEFSDGMTNVPRSSSLYHSLRHSYALTAHKVQGSQFPTVIVVAHSAHWFTNNRNLLYTALTRSLTRTIVIGNIKGVYGAVKKADEINRSTFLGKWL